MCLDLYLVTFSLRASSPGRAEKKKENLQLRLWNLNSIPNSPVTPRWLSCQISTNQREAETSANVNKHWKTRAKGNDVNIMSSPPITISHRLFWCRYSNSRDVVASSPSFSHPAARLSRRASSDAGSHLGLPKKKKQTNKQIQRWKKVKWWLTLQYFKILAKDTANPLSHHAIASLNFFNWMQALAPVTV